MYSSLTRQYHNTHHVILLAAYCEPYKNICTGPVPILTVLHLVNNYNEVEGNIVHMCQQCKIYLGDKYQRIDYDNLKFPLIVYTLPG